MMSLPKKSQHFRSHWKERTGYTIDQLPTLWRHKKKLETLTMPHGGLFAQNHQAQTITGYTIENKWVILASQPVKGHPTLISVWPTEWWEPFKAAVSNDAYWEWVLTLPAQDSLNTL